MPPVLVARVPELLAIVNSKICHIGANRKPVSGMSLARPPCQTSVRGVWRQRASACHASDPPGEISLVLWCPCNRNRRARVVARAVQAGAVPFLVEGPAALLQQFLDDLAHVLGLDARRIQGFADHQLTPERQGGPTSQKLASRAGSRSSPTITRGMRLWLCDDTEGDSPLTPASTRDRPLPEARCYLCRRCRSLALFGPRYSQLRSCARIYRASSDRTRRWSTRRAAVAYSRNSTSWSSCSGFPCRTYVRPDPVRGPAAPEAEDQWAVPDHQIAWLPS